MRIIITFLSNVFDFVYWLLIVILQVVNFPYLSNKVKF